MCTEKRFSSYEGILKHKLKVRLVCVLIYHRNWKIYYVYTYLMVYFIKFHFTYIVSKWDLNLHFMS